MTINEQIKILDNKIRSNQAQYDLDRQNAKISALSSGELNKYEYLTGEDLGYKPDVVQKVKTVRYKIYWLHIQKKIITRSKKSARKTWF